VLVLYLVILVLLCKQVCQSLWCQHLVFCLFICRHKVSFIGGDTALLGRLAKAGCFGKVGNICDAFGRKCVLSGNRA
jgi:hypothetical protein